MENRMLSFQPENLKTSELLRIVHTYSDQVTPTFVTELRKRLESAADIVTGNTDDDTKIVLLRNLLA
jgi:hypothetical protein